MATSFRTGNELTFTTDGTTIACQIQASESNLTFGSTGGPVSLTNVGAVNIVDSTLSTSKSTGALVVAGGVGIGGETYVDGNVHIDNHELLTVNYGLSEVDERVLVRGMFNGSSAPWYNVDTAGVGTLGKIAVSADGNVIYWTNGDIGVIRVSIDGGTTWQTTLAPSLPWSDVATNIDGSIVCATVGAAVAYESGAYKSTDYGATWTELSTISVNYSLTYNGVAMSDDGVYILVVGTYGDLWGSVDGGATFSKKWITRYFIDLSMSHSGAIQLGIASTATGVGGLRISINSGATFARLFSTPNIKHIIGGCISDPGNSLFFTVTDLYRSTDNGTTLTLIPGISSSAFASASISSDGSNQLFSSGSTIWASEDYGITWTAIHTLSSGEGRSIQMSSNGGERFVVEFDVLQSHVWQSTVPLGGVDVTGSLHILATSSSSDPTTGSLVVSGGVGISKSVNVGNDVLVAGNLFADGIVRFTNIAESTDPASGAMVVGGGMGVGGDAFFAHDVDVSGSIKTLSYTITENDQQLVVKNHVVIPWTVTHPTSLVQTYDQIVISHNGQNQHLLGHNTLSTLDTVLFSLDYGSTWSSSQLLETSINFIATSGNGSILFTSTSTNTYRSTIGSTLPTTIFGPSNVTAVSSDGNVVLVAANANNLQISYDSGATITPRLALNDWTYVAMSDTGQFQSAIDSLGVTWSSSDTGNTYIQESVPLGLVGIVFSGTNADYRLCYTSTDFYRSVNFGAWVLVPGVDGVPSSAAISSTGKIQVIVSNTNILESFDWGKSWNLRVSTATVNYKSPAMASDGIRKIALNSNVGGAIDNGILTSISTFPILDIDGSTHILNDTPSINLSTGALIVEGGVAFVGDANIGGTVSVASSQLSTSSTTGSLTVAGGAGFGNDLWVGGNVISSSDRRLKTKIVPLDIVEATDLIKKVVPVSYHWIDESKSQTQMCGVVAQDIQKVFPKLVYGDNETEFAVDYRSLYTNLLASHQNVIRRLENIEEQL
jgi:hypothetical protein